MSTKSLLITFDFPPIVSGISTAFYNIWKYLPIDGTFILAPKVKGYFGFDSEYRIKVIRYFFPLGQSIWKKIIREFLLYIYTLRIINKEKINLLICGQPISIGFIGLIFKKRFKIPYHVWVYGGEIIKFGKKKFLLKLLELILKNADRIITNSSYTNSVFLDFGMEREKLIKVNPAVDIEWFKPGLDINDLIKQYNLEDRKVIMTVGRLVPRKGNDMVIRALRKVKEKIPDIVYLIVGEGPNKENLEGLVRELGLGKNVVFTGFVSDKDLPKYYNLCDLYVLPNRMTEDSDTVEGFGLSFVEASACAKPVIGGRSGGACDSVLDGITGFLVESNNPRMIADKIIEILLNKELADRLGREGRDRVFREFQWEKSSRIVENLLKGYSKNRYA